MTVRTSPPLRSYIVACALHIVNQAALGYQDFSAYALISDHAIVYELVGFAFADTHGFRKLLDR